jgi:hypothetical protein
MRLKGSVIVHYIKMEDNIKVIKTTSENDDFIKLVSALDQSLWTVSELTSDYWGNNILEVNPNVVVLYLDNKAVACDVSRIRERHEIKRMFVLPEVRGRGLPKVFCRI